MSIRNIQVIVDALALASGETHERAVFLVDDGPESTGRGTLGLASVVAPGDLVRWSVIPIDLQAPAFIRALTFPGAPAEAGDAGVPGATPPAPPADGAAPATDALGGAAAPVVGRSLIWEGIVPLMAGGAGSHPYVLHLAFTDHHPVTISVAGPALHVRTSGVPPLPPGSLLAADDVL